MFTRGFPGACYIHSLIEISHLPLSLSGEWKDDNTRALLWRLLLGVIPRDAPPSQWAKEMANKRAEYRTLVAEHRVDIAKVRGFASRSTL